MIDFFIQRGKSTFYSFFEYVHVGCFDTLYSIFSQAMGKSFDCVSDDENKRKLLGKVKLLSSNADTDVKMITFMDILKSTDHYQPNEEETAFLAYYLDQLPDDEKTFLESIDFPVELGEAESAILKKYSKLQQKIILCFSSSDREVKSTFLWQIHQYMLKKSRYYLLSQLRAERVKDHQEEILSILEILEKEVGEGKDALYLAFRVREFFLDFQKKSIRAPRVQAAVSKIIVI